MGNERLTLEIAAKAIGQESIDQLSASLDRFTAASETAGKRTGAAFKEMGTSAEGSSMNIRKLFLAVKDLGEGRNSFATVEAGYFIQSLGGIATAAGFAAVGIGAIAYGIYRANEAVREGGPKMANAFDGLNGSIRKANDELRVTGDRLRNEIAALEGKPQNTLALSLDEARLAADNLADSIRKDIEAEDELIKKQGIGRLNAFFTRRTSTSSDETEITESGKRLNAIDRAGLASVRAAKDDDSRKAAQSEWNRKALAELDADSARFSDHVTQSQLKDKFNKGKLSAEETRRYIAKYGPIDTTSMDESANLEFRQGAVDNFNERRDKYSLTTGDDEAQARLNKLKAEKELQESNKRTAEAAKAERTKEQEMLKGGMDETLGQLKRDHDLVIGEESAFWTTRLAEVDKFGGRYLTLHKDIIDKLGNLAQERGAINKRVTNELNDAVIKGWDAITKEQDETRRRMGGVDVETSANEGSRTLDLASRGVLDVKLSNLDIQRRGMQRASQLTPVGASESSVVASRIADSAKLQQIDQQEAALRIQEEVKLLNQMDVLDTDKRQAQEDKILQMRRETNNKIYEDETRTLELIHAEQVKQLEGFKNEIGSIFDAATSHQPKALQNLIREQVMGVGKTITENAAAEFIYPTLNKIMPHASDPNSTFGKLLGGTPFGADPLKLSTDANTAATILNTQAILARSATGGGGGLPSSAGIQSALSAVGLGGGAADGGASGVAGDIGDGLPMTASGTYGATATPMSKVSFGGTTLGKDIGLGIAAAGGAFSAFNDFRSGGAKNDIAGVGAGLGSAAAIAAMIPGGQIVALGLGIASAATSLISAVMPDPHVVRENAINKALATNQYVAPQALNVTQGSDGTFTDFDAHGNIRSSNFSAVPTVRQGSTWEQTHGLFGGPPTFYNVPGGQTGQFGAPVAPAPPPLVINLSAIDTQSGVDFLNKNHMAVGTAAATAMQNAHGALTTEVQRAAGG